MVQQFVDLTVNYVFCMDQRHIPTSVNPISNSVLKKHFEQKSLKPNFKDGRLIFFTLTEPVLLCEKN